MALEWRLMDYDGLAAGFDGGGFECRYLGSGRWELWQDGQRLTMGSLQDCMKESGRQVKQQRWAAKQRALRQELNRLQNKQILTRKDQQRIFSLLKQVTPETANGCET